MILSVKDENNALLNSRRGPYRFDHTSPVLWEKTEDAAWGDPHYGD